MATKAKSRSGGSKDTPTLQQQRDPAKDVRARREGRQDVTHPAGADVKANKDRAGKREEKAAEDRNKKGDEFGVVSNPSLLQEARDKELEQVRDRNAQLREEHRYHGRTEIEIEIKGVESAPGKDDGGSLLLGTAGGRLYVSCSKKEIVINANGASDLHKFAQSLLTGGAVV